MRVERMLTRGVRGLAVLVAASALAACDVMVSSMNAQGRAGDEWARSYPITADGTLEIVNGNGEVDVTAGDVSQIEVKVERTAKASTDDLAREYLAKVEIAEEVSPNRVRLETRTPPRINRSWAELKYHVIVPETISVSVRNTNGTVVIAGISGDVRAETTNGGVKGRDLSGRVEATSTNGGVVLDLKAISPGGVRAETTNGGIELQVPADAKADVKASVVNGGISLTGLSLEGGERTRRRVEGRLNGGGPRVEVDTTNGGVRISAR